MKWRFLTMIALLVAIDQVIKLSMGMEYARLYDAAPLVCCYQYSSNHNCDSAL